MSEINAIHGIPSYYLKIHFNIILPSILISSQLSHLCSPTRTLHIFLFYTICVSCIQWQFRKYKMMMVIHTCGFLLMKWRVLYCGTLLFYTLAAWKVSTPSNVYFVNTTLNSCIWMALLLLLLLANIAAYVLAAGDLLKNSECLFIRLRELYRCLKLFLLVPNVWCLAISHCYVPVHCNPQDQFDFL